MEFCIKTRLGYKSVSPDEADFVILPVNEYETLIQSKNDLKDLFKSKIEKLKKRHQEELHDQFNDLLEDRHTDLKELEDKARKEKKELEEIIHALTIEKNELLEDRDFYHQEAERLDSLNANLLRISRERANTANGQSRKKGSGYIILSSSQYHDRALDDYYNAPPVVWKTIVHTHYDASLTLNEIRREIRRDLLYKVLGMMGVSVLQTHAKNGEIETWTDPETGLALNGVYRVLYLVNVKDGFWELALYHTLPVSIPQELRPSPHPGKERKG